MRDVTLTAAPASPKKTEIAVNETTALKTSDDGRKPTETDSPTHQSDDSALNKTEVTLVEETAPERVETPAKKSSEEAVETLFEEEHPDGQISRREESERGAKGGETKAESEIGEKSIATSVTSK